MRRIITALLWIVGLTVLMWQGPPGLVAGGTKGYIVERDSDVARPGPGPHNGVGRSTGYVFFDQVADFKLSFRKRVLHPGSSIGYHKQETDEVYYILSGNGTMTINGRKFAVNPGDAILTRAGSSHGVVQKGDADLAIIITYER